MEKGEMVRQLDSLIRLELDAVQAYEIALGKVRDANAKKYFSLWRDEHRRQIGGLAKAVDALGLGSPRQYEDFSKDMNAQSVLTQGFRDVRVLSDEREIVEAMLENERFSMRCYDEARRRLADLPMDMKAQLFDHQKLDQSHSDAIEKELLGRSGPGQTEH